MFTAHDFSRVPFGGAAHLPDDSVYRAAIRLPDNQADLFPWALFRGHGDQAALDWYDDEWMVTAGATL